MNNDKYHIQCSNCGWTIEISDTDTENITSRKWDSIGNAFYCLYCVQNMNQTSKNRLQGKDHTEKLVLKTIIKQQQSLINYLTQEETED